MPRYHLISCILAIQASRYLHESCIRAEILIVVPLPFLLCIFSFSRFCSTATGARWHGWIVAGSKHVDSVWWRYVFSFTGSRHLASLAPSGAALPALFVCTEYSVDAEDVCVVT